MCLIIAIISLALSYSYFTAQNYFASTASLIVAIVFTIFMIRNILYVRKSKREKKDDN